MAKTFTIKDQSLRSLITLLNWYRSCLCLSLWDSCPCRRNLFILTGRAGTTHCLAHSFSSQPPDTYTIKIQGSSSKGSQTDNHGNIISRAITVNKTQRLKLNTSEKVVCVFQWKTMDLIGPGFPKMGCGLLTETTPLNHPPHSLSLFHSLSLPSPRWEISVVLTEATFVLVVPGAERYRGPSPHLNKQHLMKHLLHWEADS